MNDLEIRVLGSLCREQFYLGVQSPRHPAIRWKKQRVSQLVPLRDFTFQRKDVGNADNIGNGPLTARDELTRSQRNAFHRVTRDNSSRNFGK